MIVLFILLIQAEARVFCQDSHAQPWEPLGYSCPINCDNVITAVRKLKALEFGKLFSNEDIKIDTKDKMLETRSTVPYEHHLFNYPYNVTNKNREINNKSMRRNNISPEAVLYKRYYKILNNEGVVRDLKTEFKDAMSSLKECYSHNEVKHTFSKTINKKCVRRANIETDFLKKFTSILNRYTNSIPFTEELTAMILEKVLGKNLDLRHGLFDVNKILVFLSNAIRNHEQSRERQNGPVINLRSGHCLSLHVPGCFCMSGFVEKTGQCVIPADCFEGAIEKELLTRVIVN